MAEEGQQDQNPTGNTEQGGGDAKWYDSLPDDIKGNDAIKGFDGFESLAKAHLTTQAQLAELQAKVPVVPEKPRNTVCLISSRVCRMSLSRLSRPSSRDSFTSSV